MKVYDGLTDCVASDEEAERVRRTLYRTEAPRPARSSFPRTAHASTAALLHHGTPPNRSPDRRRAHQFHFAASRCRRMTFREHT